MPFKPVLAATVLLASTVGVGSYTFTYADGASYLSSDPAACANCHVMEDHYAAWMKSSHRDVATCQDCHTPPEGGLSALSNKAVNGFLHASAFTTGDYPYPLRIRGFNAEVTQAACRSCHVLAEDMATSAHAEVTDKEGQELSCVKCHPGVGHSLR